MAGVYIIFSDTLNKFYIGATSLDPQQRLDEHNRARFRHHFTAAANDWVLKLFIPCHSFAHARKIESFIKQMKSRRFILKLIQHPHEVNILLNRFTATDSPE